MGLTKASTGGGAVDGGITVTKRREGDRIIALAGNPNVGKSTVFNALTGMDQHTGNWPGKTVANAEGYCRFGDDGYVLVDIPGTYSLMAHSAEEEVAGDFICFGGADAVAVVCDATCLERNMNLVLQIIETGKKALVCVNLMDEAKHRGVKIDTELLSKRLGVPVVGTVARKKKSLHALISAFGKAEVGGEGARIYYGETVERAVHVIEECIAPLVGDIINPRWAALRLLDTGGSAASMIRRYMGDEFLADERVCRAIDEGQRILADGGIDNKELKTITVSAIVKKAEDICRGAVTYERSGYDACDRRLDRILTGKLTGYPLMLALLAVVFWITISGANYPSELLSNLLFKGQDLLSEALRAIGVPIWLHDCIVYGLYRVPAWVISVMLPPMAIFFPLFTLLEDSGYLPRIAYNLDRPFKCCGACGKQALTMCMGFGCNAAGIVGCRIIDSPRERMLAILTNSFVPCNGRFPALIAMISMFFVGAAGGIVSSVTSAVILTAVILFGILATFVSTRLLSKTVLRGAASSFTLELPPYRRPQVGRVIVRSIFDRTLFVLGRAVVSAVPAGIIIWLAANVDVAGASLLHHAAVFLDPAARLMGLDGVILMAFILGLPANEIVVPIMIMAYTSEGVLTDALSLTELRVLLTANGWTWITAVSMMIFIMMHWPCATSLLTVKKETGSLKWTAVAALLPTAAGVLCCIIFTAVARIITGA